MSDYRWQQMLEERRRWEEDEEAQAEYLTWLESLRRFYESEQSGYLG